MDYGIAWIANGFHPEDPRRLDDYAMTCLEAAMRAYKNAKENGYDVAFLVINSIVRDNSGEVVLSEVILKTARAAGVAEEDIVLLPTETTGSPTDGLSVARWAKANPEALVGVFVTTAAAKKYIEAMYRAVAWYLEGYRLRANFSYTVMKGSESRKSRLVYTLLHWTTWLAAKTRMGFMRWYNFLNRAFQHRVHGFTRTVT